MRTFGICLIFLLCFSKTFCRFHPTINEHHHNYRPHTHPIAQYILSKIQSIISWLNSLQDTTAFDYIYHVNKGMGLNFYQGDIRQHDTNRHKRAAVRLTERLWTTRTIPYTFDAGFDLNERRAVLAGIEEFHNKTCLFFIPRTTETDYINFSQNQGCSSDIGRRGNQQDVSLMSSCLIKGTVIHELMHAIGFFHEQGRPDRDSWIQVIYSNIETGKEFNFNKESSNDVTTLGLQYDYGSVMHYSRYAFTKNGGPTLQPIFQTSAKLGQRDGMSYMDAKKINKLYRCGQSFANLPTVPQRIPTKIPILATDGTTKATTASVHIKTPATLHQMQTAVHTAPRPTPHVPTKQPTPPIPVIRGWTPWTDWSSCDLQCNRKRYRICMNSDRSSCHGDKTDYAPCILTCQPLYELGCWGENSTDLAIPAAYGISTLSNTHAQDISNIKPCGEFAAMNGNSVFALFNQRVCLTGPHAASTYMKYAPSSDCVSNGLGGQAASNVYSLQKDRDGNWSPWSKWGPCSRTCGGGQQFRYRQCNDPSPFGAGARCQGLDREYESCNSMTCTVEAKCGTKYHTGVVGTSGIISLKNYSNFMECQYEILTGDPNATISLVITRMNIEYGASCIYDSLMIFDGPDSTSRLIGSYCGNTSPSAIQSTTNTLFLKFESDETNTGNGFELMYTINSKTRKSCVRPMVNAHTTIIGNPRTNFVGDTVRYRCEDSSYHLIGSSDITCVDQTHMAVWSDSFPFCIKNIKRSTRQFGSKICTFEGNLCGFTQDNKNTFDWSLHRAITDNFVSATQNYIVPELPLDDKTKGSSGYYFAAKSSRLQKAGDTARLYTPLIYPHGSQCLHFWYQTNGRENNTRFRVYIKSAKNAGSQGRLFETSIDTSFIWKDIDITLNQENPYQIVFEHMVGDRYGTYSAIDDVMITNGACDEDNV